MSSMPPYENGNPYVPPTQYPSSGYQQQSGYQYPSSGYQQPNVYATPMYVAQPYAVMAINDPKAGQALAGMILGIAGLLFSFFGLVPLLGLIFSIIGMRSTTRKGMAVAGLVMSIIGLVLAVCATIFLISLFVAAASVPLAPTP